MRTAACVVTCASQACSVWGIMVTCMVRGKGRVRVRVRVRG